MGMRGSTSTTIQTWYCLRMRTGMPLWVCSDLSSSHIFDVFQFFRCFWCLTQYLFVLYRSCTITIGRDVAVNTEGCFTGRSWSEQHHRRVRIDLDEVEESLTQLTIFVPLTKDEDIPLCMCHHASGGSSRFSRLFRKVAQVVICYREHQHDD